MRLFRNAWFQYAVMVVGLAAVASAVSSILEQRAKNLRDMEDRGFYTSPVTAGKVSGPNVILIVSDATRRDAMSPYGVEPDDRTPNIARLARDGVVFDAAYSAASFSGPSYASLLTGRYPPRHGVFDHPKTLPGQNRTLLEVASDAGYYTLHLTQHPYLSTKWHYDQGADHYRRSDPDVLVDDLTSWIADNPGVPFVAFIVLTIPHYPYGLRHRDDLFGGLSLRDRVLSGLAEPLQLMFDFDATGLSQAYVRAQRESYLREVTGSDAEVGKIAEAVRSAGIERNTVVLVTADHGEAFGEHGFYFCHDPVIYGPVTRVPLIAMWPGRLRPGRIEQPVSLVDVMPTLVEWIGGEIGAPVDGRSLVAKLERGVDLPERTLFSFSRKFSRASRERFPVLAEQYRLDGYRGCPFQGVRGRWDVVVRPLPEGFACQVFDRASDPLDLDDLWPDHGDDAEVQRIVDEVKAYRAWFLSRAIPDEKPLTEEQRKALRALGYLE